MHLNFFFVVIVLLNASESRKIEIKCPLHCKCDIFDNFKRATCQNRNLATIEADVPEEVELLDLSYNLIRELQDHIFFDLNLTSLKLLNLSHNSISQIHMNAFYDLKTVRTVDLSYNNIEYLLVNWFWDISTLQELYLNKNNLRQLSPGPLIESRSLRVLDLSSCNILYIQDDAFSKLPNLETLDVSLNSLLELNVKVITTLTSLNQLKLANNSWECNAVMKNLSSYCKKKGIAYIDPCAKPTKLSHQFEKMMKLELDVDDRNSWIYDDKENQENNTVVISMCANSTSSKTDTIIQIILLSPLLALIASFTCGAVVGLVLTCSMCVLLFPKRATERRPLSRRISVIRNRRSSNEIYDYALIQTDSFEANNTTPIPQRKCLLQNNTNN